MCGGRPRAATGSDCLQIRVFSLPFEICNPSTRTKEMASKQGGKKKRTVAEVGPVEVVDGYEKVMLEDGGFKRRRVGAKKWTRMCEHSRQPNLCKECGGASICEHGRRRSSCKDCGGASVCEHGRQRSHCKDCGGASICEHGR